LATDLKLTSNNKWLGLIGFFRYNAPTVKLGGLCYWWVEI